MALPSAAVSVFRLFLGSLIAFSILANIFGVFVYLTNWWGEGTPWAYEREPKPSMQMFYHAFSDRYLEQGASIYPWVYGSTNATFIFLFGSTIVAAVCTMLLRSLPTHRVSEEQQKQGFHGAARRCWLQVKRILFFQLPPRSLWLWWCGGLHVVDAFLILAVCGAAALGCQQLVEGMYEYIAGLIADGTFADYYEGESVSLAKFEAIALRSGFMIYPPFLYMMYPVPRNSFLQALFGTDFSYLIRYHRWLGHLVMITTSIHGILYYILWGIQSNFRVEIRHWQMHGISNLAGSISYFFGIILWATSFEYVRRKHFEVFYKLHIIGALGFFVFGFMHYDGFWYYGSPGLLLYLLDLTFRLAQWMNVSIVTGSLLSENVLALNLQFTPETRLEPNSFVFITSPDASRAQTHPFTLSLVRNSTSPNEPARATIYLKPYGHWVQALVRRITQKGSALVKVDGPYGGASSLMQADCQAAVIIAGGIGVTPMLGLLAALRDRRTSAEFHGSITSPSVPQKVVFVWACRDNSEFELLDEQLLAEARQENSWLEIHLCCTGAGGGSPVKSAQYGSNGNYPGTAANGANGAHSNGNYPGSAANGANGTEGKLTLKETVKANNERFPALDRPELKLASPFFLKPSLLQAYGIGYPLWALVHLLCFFGAYMTVLLADNWVTLDSAVREDGNIYWVFCTLEMLCMVIGGMGLPALVIFPVFLYRHFRARRAMNQNEASSRQPGAILASIQDAADSKLEAGTQLTYTHGRPDVRGILKHMKKEYDHLSEIDVYAAGPPGMVRDVKFHCTDLNNFFKSGPQLVYEIDSFSL